MKSAHDYILISALLCVTALAGPVAAVALAPAPGSAGPVLIIAPNPAEIVVATGGWEVSPLRTKWAVLAQGDAGFVSRVQSAGAWRVTDGQWVAAICNTFRGDPA